MRILVCNWKDRAHPLAGGAEVWTQGVANAWVEAGHDVTLACSTAPGLPEEDHDNGVRILRGGDYRLGVHGHARRVYAERAFDLVVDEVNTRPFGAPRWARNSRVIAFIHQLAREVWFRETPFPVALAGRFVLEPRWLRGYAAVPVFTPSVSSAMSLAAYGLPDAIALPQCSDLPPTPSLSAKADRPTFAFVGRLCAMKRPFAALEAFARVQSAVPDARLVIIGAGPEESAVRRAVAKMPGAQCLGNVTRAVRDAHLGASHALLVTSVREGWGLVVSEAAAVGTGTIGYDVPGLTDSITATGGVLVRPNPAALADEMMRVALDPERAPRPRSTGTVPFADVARMMLERSEVTAHV